MQQMTLVVVEDTPAFRSRAGSGSGGMIRPS
jgi:hypothetical protein